jgi:hypothetical protein
LGRGAQPEHPGGLPLDLEENADADDVAGLCGDPQDAVPEPPTSSGGQ